MQRAGEPAWEVAAAAFVLGNRQNDRWRGPKETGLMLGLLRQPGGSRASHANAPFMPKGGRPWSIPAGAPWSLLLTPNDLEAEGAAGTRVAPTDPAGAGA